MDSLQKVGLIAGLVAVGLVAREALRGPVVPTLGVGQVGGVITAINDDISQIGWTPSADTWPPTDLGSLVIWWRREGAQLPNARGLFGTGWKSFDPNDYTAFQIWAGKVGAAVPASPPAAWGIT